MSLLEKLIEANKELKGIVQRMEDKEWRFSAYGNHWNKEPGINLSIDHENEILSLGFIFEKGKRYEGNGLEYTKETFKFDAEKLDIKNFGEISKSDVFDLIGLAMRRRGEELVKSVKNTHVNPEDMGDSERYIRHHASRINNELRTSFRPPRPKEIKVDDKLGGLDGLAVSAKQAEGRSLDKTSPFKIEMHVVDQYFNMKFQFEGGYTKEFKVNKENFTAENPHLSGKEIMMSFLQRAFKDTKFGEDQRNLEKLLKNAEAEIVGRRRTEVYKDILSTVRRINPTQKGEKMSADTWNTKRYFPEHVYRGKKKESFIVRNDAEYDGFVKMVKRKDITNRIDKSWLKDR